jgi:DNA-binding NtrC family response regulator
MFTILHLDDEDKVRQRVREVLTGTGYHVQSASSVDEAMRLMENQHFDMILSDSDLPNRLEGVHFVLSVKDRSPEQPIAILADKLQLRKIPFISKGFLSDTDMFLSLFNQAFGVR